MAKIDAHGEVTLSGQETEQLYEWLKDHPEYQEQPWKNALHAWMEDTKKIQE